MTDPQHSPDDPITPEPVDAPEPVAPAMLANPRRNRWAHLTSPDDPTATGATSV